MTRNGIRKMTPAASSIDIRQISTNDGMALADFFTSLSGDPEIISFFHPHPFTREYARELCANANERKDRYYVASLKGIVVAYMMLRGWDEGYSVPSFGVCAHPELREVGLGQTLLAHAVAESKAAGAEKLRLTVFKVNERAVHVYRKFGFVFQDKNEHELVGILDLGKDPSIAVRPINLTKINAWFEGRAQAA
jgi:ribosomal protein S18 acetylase RimI-like enzyme